VAVNERRGTRGRAAALYVLAALFIAAGVMHFVIPRSYAAIVPTFLPARLFLVYLSGAAELAGGVGLLVPRVRRPAALGLIALLAAVFPANVQMLANALAATKPQWQVALLWARLPLQLVLIYIIWKMAGGRPKGDG
jgi:uncharacterized membrane protein